MIYDDLKLNDIPGWLLPEEAEWLYQTAKKAHRVVEIGCFMGRSTCAILAGCPNVTVVDTFDARGTVRHAEFDGPKGRVKLLQAFRDNVAARQLPMPEILIGQSRDILPLDYTTESFDMVFIDGSHDQETVWCDIARSWRTVGRPAIVCGHDYHPTEWPGVVAAVNEFAIANHDIRLEMPVGTIWSMTR